jgi:hypothetical protein
MIGGSGESETLVTFTGLLASSHRRQVILSERAGAATAITMKATSLRGSHITSTQQRDCQQVAD